MQKAPKARDRDNAKRRPYAPPKVRSERFAERHAMACPKGTEHVTTSCIDFTGYTS